MTDSMKAERAEERGQGICRTCLSPIWNEGGAVAGEKRAQGWSDRIEQGGDSLVCFSARDYRHVPLAGREAAVYDVALGRSARVTDDDREALERIVSAAVYGDPDNLSRATEAIDAILAAGFSRSSKGGVMYAVVNENGGHEVGFCGTLAGAEKLAEEMRESHPWAYRVEARCDYGVTRRGEAMPCDALAVGERVDDGDDRAYPVCKRHFNKAKQPPLPWADHAIARRDPATGEPLESRVAHWRPCRDHEAHFAAGMLVLSCSRCLSCGGALADCDEHREKAGANV